MLPDVGTRLRRKVNVLPWPQVAHPDSPSPVLNHPHPEVLDGPQLPTDPMTVTLLDHSQAMAGAAVTVAGTVASAKASATRRTVRRSPVVTGNESFVVFMGFLCDQVDGWADELRSSAFWRSTTVGAGQAAAEYERAVARMV
jgi:hypothetical protein